MKYEKLVKEFIDVLNDFISTGNNVRKDNSIYTYGEFEVKIFDQNNEIFIVYHDKLRGRNFCLYRRSYLKIDESAWKQVYIELVKYSSLFVTCSHKYGDDRTCNFYSIRDLVLRGMYLDGPDVMRYNKELNNIEIV